MRQVNFVLIFVICLALVLFALENTELVTINVVQGWQLKAPLSVELILATGLGAVFAWVFSVWVQMQGRLNEDVREVKIQELEQDLARYRAEIEQQQQLLPAAKDL